MKHLVKVIATVFAVLVLSVPATADLSVPVTGQGAECELSSSPIAFGVVKVGQSAVSSATITNISGVTCTVTAINLVGDPDFSLTASPTLPVTLAPGQNLPTTQITFSPTSAGAKTASLDITAN